MTPEHLAGVAIEVVSKFAAANIGQTFIPIRALLELLASPMVADAVAKALREEIKSIDGLDARVIP